MEGIRTPANFHKYAKSTDTQERLKQMLRLQQMIAILFQLER